MRLTKREVIVMLILTIFSFIGHYYLSWHCTLPPQGRYIGKFIWIVVMVLTGYIGLLKHEVVWVSKFWIVINLLLMLCFGIDKLLSLYYHKEAIFRIASHLFTVPIPFLGACIVPRIFVAQFRKHLKRLDN
ncbi:hypothetical protein [Mucilaginibacter sp. CSA2-8R]|uniref:hypothetical protein n=1 Tax=Mucilaginibacter sp. CSA2-8R TaxID=3141542 RepID=UPI00315CD17B